MGSMEKAAPCYLLSSTRFLCVGHPMTKKGGRSDLNYIASCIPPNAAAQTALKTGSQQALICNAIFCMSPDGTSHRFQTLSQAKTEEKSRSWTRIGFGAVTDEGVLPSFRVSRLHRYIFLSVTLAPLSNCQKVSCTVLLLPPFSS